MTTRLLSFVALFVATTNFVTAQTNKWECEDDCLEKSGDLLCGTTDHFKPSIPGGEIANTVVVLSDGNYLMINENSGNGESEAGITISKVGADNGVIWTNKVFSTESITPNDVTEDINGNIIVVGGFKGQAFSDDGSFDALAEGETDTFTISYDGSGNTNWGVSNGAEGEDRAQQVITDGDGNIYVGGTFSGDVNFNTNPEGDVINLVYVLSEGCGYMQKLDPNGITSWATAIDLYAELAIAEMEVDGEGSVVFSGKYCSQVSFDNPTFVGCDGAQNNVLAGKINPDGNTEWTGSIESENALTLRDMIITGDGGIYLAGSFEGATDFDLGEEVQESTSGTGADLYVVRYDSNGQLVHPHLIDWTNGDDSGECLAEDENGALLVIYDSAIDTEADLICPTGDCVSEVTHGLLYLTPGMNEGGRVFVPCWSNAMSRGSEDDYRNELSGGTLTVHVCHLRTIQVNTGIGAVTVDAAIGEPLSLSFNIELKGCTDPTACNYDSAASLNDGTCLYAATCAECGGDGGNCIGCQDESACNYAPDALLSDECTYPDGCTDPTALNYNAGATCDDGTCVFTDTICGICTVWDEELGTCVEDPACATCFGDSNGDNAIDIADLLAFLGVLGLECE